MFLIFEIKLKIGLVSCCGDLLRTAAHRFTLCPLHRLWLVQALVVALRQRIDDRDDKVGDHQNDKLLKDARQQITTATGSTRRPSRSLAMQMRLLVAEERLKGLLQWLAHQRNVCQQVDRLLDERLVEGDHHKYLLDVHLDHSLADQRGPEEGPEWHQEVATSNSRQIKQWIWDLQGKRDGLAFN